MTIHNPLSETVMRPLRKTLIESAATVALVGVAGLAVAAIMNTHALDVRLPDGSVAHVRYIGDRPPSALFAAAPMSIPMLSPDFQRAGSDPTFAALERLSEAMDLEAAAMTGEASAGSRPAFAGPDPVEVDLGTLGPGARGFSMASAGSGVCARSVEYSWFGDGRPPRVVTYTSGSCATAEKRPAPSMASGAITAISRPARAAPQSI